MVGLQWEFAHSVSETIRNYASPTPFESYLQQALRALDIHSFEQAEQYFQQAQALVVQNPTPPSPNAITADHLVCYYFLGGKIAEALHQHETAFEYFLRCKEYMDGSTQETSIARAIEVNYKLVGASNNLGYYLSGIICCRFIKTQALNRTLWQGIIRYDADAFLTRVNLQHAEQLIGMGFFNGAHEVLARVQAQLNGWAMLRLRAIDPAHGDELIEHWLTQMRSAPLPAAIPLTALGLGDLNTTAVNDQVLCNWIGLHIFSRWHHFRNYYWAMRVRKTPFDLATWQALLPLLDAAVADLEAYMPDSETAARFALFRVDFLLLPCEFQPANQWNVYIAAAEHSMVQAIAAVNRALKTAVVERGDVLLLYELTDFEVQKWKTNEAIKTFDRLKESERLWFQERLQGLETKTQQLGAEASKNIDYLHIVGRAHIQAIYLVRLMLELNPDASPAVRNALKLRIESHKAAALAIFENKRGAHFYPRVAEIKQIT